MIIPKLWFDRQAKEAARFYVSTFKDSKIGNVTRATKAGFEIHGIPESAVMNLVFEIEGMRFIGINSGPLLSSRPPYPS